MKENFSSEEKSEDSALLIDIGSSSVGGVIVSFAKNKKPKILYTVRRELPFSKLVTGPKTVSAMRLSLESMLSELSTKGFLETGGRFLGRHHPDRVICTLSSPWHLSTIRDVNFQFDEKEELDIGFLRDVLDNEEKEFSEKLKKNELFGDKLRFIERIFIKSTVNGYQTKNPLGKKSKNFSFKVFLSVSEGEHLNQIKKVIGRHLPGRETDFRSFSGVYFSSLSQVFPEENKFLAIHISGETTDVSVVKNRAVMETASFPLGRNFMIRQAVKEIKGLEPAAALSMIRMHKIGEADQKLSKRINEILNQAEIDWSSLFFDALRDLSEGIFLPTKMFVMSGEGYSSIFADIIEKTKGSLPLKSKQIFNVTPIDADLFKNVIEWEDPNKSEPFFAIQAFHESQIREKEDFNKEFLL